MEKNKSFKRKCWFFVIIVGLIVIAGAIAATIFVTSRHKLEFNSIRTITLEDILDGTLSPEGFNASWVSGT